MPVSQLEEIAQKLVAPKKGILAADWSFGTIEKKFAKVEVDKGTDIVEAAAKAYLACSNRLLIKRGQKQ